MAISRLGRLWESEDYEGFLSYEVEYMDEDDFRDLIEQLENLVP